MPTNTTIRQATTQDAPALARLIDLAGEGLPSFLWDENAEPGETPYEVGERRATRESGGFSYRNAHILEVDGQTAGMLLGYRLPAPYDIPDLTSLPEMVRPLVELEAQAAGSWYVNGVAIFDEFRGHGYGTRLMALAEDCAREGGADRMSLIVAEANEGARRLYEQLDYTVQARQPVVAFPGFEHGGDWLLMLKECNPM